MHRRGAGGQLEAEIGAAPLLDIAEGTLPEAAAIGPDELVARHLHGDGGLEVAELGDDLGFARGAGHDRVVIAVVHAQGHDGLVGRGEGDVARIGAVVRQELGAEVVQGLAGLEFDGADRGVVPALGELDAGGVDRIGLAGGEAVHEVLAGELELGVIAEHVGHGLALVLVGLGLGLAGAEEVLRALAGVLPLFDLLVHGVGDGLDIRELVGGNHAEVGVFPVEALELHFLVGAGDLAVPVLLPLRGVGDGPHAGAVDELDLVGHGHLAGGGQAVLGSGDGRLAEADGLDEAVADGGDLLVGGLPFEVLLVGRLFRQQGGLHLGGAADEEVDLALVELQFRGGDPLGEHVHDGGDALVAGFRRDQGDALGEGGHVAFRIDGGDGIVGGLPGELVHGGVLRDERDGEGHRLADDHVAGLRADGETLEGFFGRRRDRKRIGRILIGVHLRAGESAHEGRSGKNGKYLFHIVITCHFELVEKSKAFL